MLTRRSLANGSCWVWAPTAACAYSKTNRSRSQPPPTPRVPSAVYAPPCALSMPCAPRALVPCTPRSAVSRALDYLGAAEGLPAAEPKLSTVNAETVTVSPEDLQGLLEVEIANLAEQETMHSCSAVLPKLVANPQWMSEGAHAAVCAASRRRARQALEALMGSLGMEDSDKAVLRNQNLDIPTLLTLSEADLRGIGLSSLHALKKIAAWQQQQQQQAGPGVAQGAAAPVAVVPGVEHAPCVAELPAPTGPVTSGLCIEFHCREVAGFEDIFKSWMAVIQGNPCPTDPLQVCTVQRSGGKGSA